MTALPHVTSTGNKAVLFYIGSGTASPSTYTLLAQLIDFDGPNLSAEQIDITTVDDAGIRKYMAGLRDYGQFNVTIMWDPSLPTHGSGASGLLGLFENGTERRCKILWATSGIVSLFNAIVLNIGPSAPLNGKVTARVTFKMTTGLNTN